MARKNTTTTTTDSTPAADAAQVYYEEGENDSLRVSLDIPADQRKLSAHGVEADLSSVDAAGLIYLLHNGWSGAITDSVSGHKGKYRDEGLPADEIESRLDATRQAKGQAICAGEMRLGGGGGARISERDKMIRDTARMALVKAGALSKDAKVREAQPIIDDFLATPKGQKLVVQVDTMLAVMGD